MDDMVYEFYFTKHGERVDARSWVDFLEHKANNTLNSSYEEYKANSQEQKEIFGFNPNGDVLFFDSDGKRYKGYWFDTSNTRISILKNGNANGNI